MRNELSVHYRGKGHNFTWCGRSIHDHPDDRITEYNPLATCRKCLAPSPSANYVCEGMRLEASR